MSAEADSGHKIHESNLLDIVLSQQSISIGCHLLAANKEAQMFGVVLGRTIFVALLAAIGWWVLALIRKSDQRRKASIASLVMLVFLVVWGESEYAFLDEPLVNSARDGNLADVRRLLNLGADIDSPGDDGLGTPLVAAVAEDHPAVVQLLIRRGANVSKSADYVFNKLGNQTPLEAAAGHPAIIAMLKKAGARE